ncbi:MAG: CDP-diglyceride synthetase [Planctomycetota bacterium]|jgi:CDP-diglyceride synthetase
MATRLQKVAKRTVVGAAIVAVLWFVLDQAWESSTGLVVWSAALLLTAGCVFEVSRMNKIVDRKFILPLWLGLICSLLPGAAHYFGEDLLGSRQLFETDYLSDRGWLLGLLLGVLGTVLSAFFLAAKQTKPGLALLLPAWLFTPLCALTLIWSKFGPEGLVAIIVLSKIGDVFGYYVGNAMGKSHPFPNISPGKTTAGCVASLVAGTLAGAACVWFGYLPGGEVALVAGLIAGAVINIASQLGDLVESKLKRMASVKDSGTWFGPSGGCLDLVDSLLLSVPAALISWPLLFA